MGIMSGLAKHMIENRINYKIDGHLIALGEQTIFLLPNDFKAIIEPLGINVEVSVKQPQQDVDVEDLYINADCFFRALGATKTQSLDISSYQGADILFDLNDVSLPNNLSSSADCIFDGSTVEHIFDVKQVFTNLHNMLKPGGFMFHLSPLDGLANDSFYQFGVNFFPELYTANQYETLFHRVYVYDYEHLLYADSKTNKSGNDWFFDDVQEGLIFARENNLPAQHLFAARKPISKNETFRMPYQSRYTSIEEWRSSR